MSTSEQPSRFLAEFVRRELAIEEAERVARQAAAEREAEARRQQQERDREQYRVEFVRALAVVFGIPIRHPERDATRQLVVSYRPIPAIEADLWRAGVPVEDIRWAAIHDGLGDIFDTWTVQAQGVTFYRQSELAVNVIYYDPHTGEVMVTAARRPGDVGREIAVREQARKRGAS